MIDSINQRSINTLLETQDDETMFILSFKKTSWKMCFDKDSRRMIIEND